MDSPLLLGACSARAPLGEKIGVRRDWPRSKGGTPPYVPVWIEAMGKRRG